MPASFFLAGAGAGGNHEANRDRRCRFTKSLAGGNGASMARSTPLKPKPRSKAERPLLRDIEGNVQGVCERPRAGSKPAGARGDKG